MQTVNTSNKGGGSNRVFHRGSIEFNQGFAVVRCDSEGKILAAYAAAMRMRDGERDHLFFTLPNQLLQTPDNPVVHQVLEGERKTRRVDVNVWPELLPTREVGVVVSASDTGAPNYREIMEQSTPGGWWGALQFQRNGQSGFWTTTQFALRSDWAIDTVVGASMPANNQLAFSEDAAEFARTYATAWTVFVRAAVRFGGITEESIPVGGDRLVNIPGSGLEMLEKAIEADKVFREAKQASKELERMPQSRLNSLLQRLSPAAAERLATMTRKPAADPSGTVAQ